MTDCIIIDRSRLYYLLFPATEIEHLRTLRDQIVGKTVRLPLPAAYH